MSALKQELESKYYHKITMSELEELKDKMIGLRLFIECMGRSYIGTLKHYFKEGSRMWLERAHILPTGTPVATILTILCGDIQAIKILEVDPIVRKRIEKERMREAKRSRQLKMPQIVNQINDDESDEPQFYPIGPILNSEKEEEDIIEPLPPIYPNCIRPSQEIVLENVEDLPDAISEIREENLISLVGHGFGLDRDGTLAWLSIGCSNIVYHFNILALGMKPLMTAGLGDLLVDPSVEIVIHDARCLQDYFYHKFDITMVHIFDTQATDIYMEMKNNRKMPIITREADVIFMDHLNLKVEISNLSFCVADESVWLEQPLAKRFVRSLFVSAVLLKELRQAMLEKLLQDVTIMTHHFVSALMNENPGGRAPKVELLIVPDEVQKSGQQLLGQNINDTRR